MAENERVISTVFKADISNFSASTQELNRYIKTVNSEFAAATAHLDRWSDSTEGLQAKITQLNGILSAEEKKLAELEKQYNALTDAQKQNTKAGQELAVKINNQRATVNKTKKEIDHYTDSLNELEDAGVETRQELDKLNEKIEDQKQSASEAGNAIGKGLVVGIAGIAAACVGALKGLSSLVEETKELRTQMGQLETGFTQAGHSADAAANTYNELYSVLGDSGKATEAGMHLGQLAKNEEELAQYTDILTGVYATFGDSLPVEGLAEAMNHTANLGSVQGVLADALEWSGVNVDDFNKQLEGLTTEEERAQLIQETLNGIYGETATKYKEVNKDVIAANEAQNQYNQTMAQIAEKAQPAITQFKLAMVQVLQTVLEKFNEVDIAGLIGKISGAITSLVNTVLPPLMSGLTWILDNLNWLAPLLGTIGGAIGAVTLGIKAYNAIVKIAKAVQLAWNLAMSANPIGIVITAIGALVAIIAVLWNKSETFRNFFTNMWNGIKKVVAGVAEFIGSIFKGIFNTIKGLINGVIGAINLVIKTINGITGGLSSLWEWAGIPAIPKIPSIPKLAEGGIIDKPTLAMVGEAGKEAVVPLENNTGWIDKLADKLATKMQPSVATTNNFNYTFEKMETTQLALHKANLATKRILGGNK